MSFDVVKLATNFQRQTNCDKPERNSNKLEAEFRKLPKISQINLLRVGYWHFRTFDLKLETKELVKRPIYLAVFLQLFLLNSPATFKPPKHIQHPPRFHQLFFILHLLLSKHLKVLPR
jgi:hypothetical protein